MKNKFWTMLLSLAIAFGLWLYVVTVVSPDYEETYFDIPVILQNENILAERGLMITSETPTVTLRLHGNRSNLIKLDKSNISVMANVASIEAPGTHMLSYEESYPGNIPVNSVSKQYGTPALVSLTVENKLKKTVPIAIHYDGAVPEGFIADKENVLLDYPAVEITGPESAVSQITQAVVEVELNEQNSTIAGEYKYTLCSQKGEPVDAKMVTTNTDKVNLTLKIQRVKEISLTVAIEDGGGATKDTCSITIKPAKIRISGSDNLLEKLDTLELGTIHLGVMPKDEILSFPIKLPDGVTNETGVNDAKIDVKFPDLITREFTIETITPLNVPEGMEVDMITQALDVKIRGPKSLMDQMTKDNIRVSVDFAGAQEETATMKAIVKLDSSFSAAGALNSYTVSATLRKAEEKE